MSNTDNPVEAENLIAAAIDAARDPLDGLVEKTATDPGAPFAPDALERLAALKKENRAAFEGLSELQALIFSRLMPGSFRPSIRLERAPTPSYRPCQDAPRSLRSGRRQGHRKRPPPASSRRRTRKTATGN